MKIRNGFVSNSSASSFVVVAKDLWDNKIYVTTKEINLLKKFGFKRVSCFYSDQVDGELCFNSKKKIEAKYKAINENYGYSLSCNQDDVLYFLLKNNIPFEATIHYGHETIIYKKNAKYYALIQNYGKQVSMGWYDNKYNIDKNTKSVLKYNDKAIQKIDVKKWLKRQEKWQAEYKKIEEEELKKLGEKK